MAIVGRRLKATDLFGAHFGLLIGVKDGKDEADEARIEHLIIQLSSEIDVRWERSDVRVGVVPAYDLYFRKKEVD